MKLADLGEGIHDNYVDPKKWNAVAQSLSNQFGTQQQKTQDDNKTAKADTGSIIDRLKKIFGTEDIDENANQLKLISQKQKQGQMPADQALSMFLDIIEKNPMLKNKPGNADKIKDMLLPMLQAISKMATGKEKQDIDAMINMLQNRGKTPTNPTNIPNDPKAPELSI